MKSVEIRKKLIVVGSGWEQRKEFRPIPISRSLQEDKRPAPQVWLVCAGYGGLLNWTSGVGMYTAFAVFDLAQVTNRWPSMSSIFLLFLVTYKWHLYAPTTSFDQDSLSTHHSGSVYGF
jgi:hypothetical protein